MFKYLVALGVMIVAVIAVCDASIVCSVCHAVVSHGVTVVSGSGKTLLVCQNCFLNGAYMGV